VHVRATVLPKINKRRHDDTSGKIVIHRGTSTNLSILGHTNH